MLFDSQAVVLAACISRAALAIPAGSLKLNLALEDVMLLNDRFVAAAQVWAANVSKWAVSGVETGIPLSQIVLMR